MDSTYIFLQHYWWFLVSLLGDPAGISAICARRKLVAIPSGTHRRRTDHVGEPTGRKWEFTFTTLVTFGGAFFASFPLFYSTSFGGAYWLWMIILFTLCRCRRYRMSSSRNLETCFGQTYLSILPGIERTGGSGVARSGSCYLLQRIRVPGEQRKSDR